MSSRSAFNGVLFAAFLTVLCTFAASAADADYHPHRIVIKPRAGQVTQQLQRFHGIRGVGVLRRLEAFENIEVLRLPAGLTVETALKAYRESGLVDFAEPDFKLYPAVAPNDPYYANGSSWYFENTGQSGGVADADIDGPEAWDTLHNASNVIVAVVDTGIRYTHEDLAPNMWRNPGEIPDNGVDDDRNGFVDDVHGISAVANTGDPTDVYGHGTLVAGVLGAVGNNGLGGAGVAWQIQIMACRFYDDAGNGYMSDAAQSIDYARAKGAKIINTSFVTTQYPATLYTAINNCRTAGIIVVAAAGNSTNDNDALPHYPASFNLDNVVAAAATTRTDELAPFSNYGAQSVDVGAPGTDMVLPTNTGDSSYMIGSGSSFAAPMMAGVFALARVRFPSDSYQEAISRVLQSVDPLPSLTGKCVTGGRVNLARVLGPAVVADFKMNLQGGSPPLTVAFTDQSMGEVAEWSWTFGDGGTSTLQNPSHLYLAEGTYDVQLQVKHAGGQTSSKTTNIVLTANYAIEPAAYAWIDPTGMTQIPMTGDGVSAAQTLPFTFRFYGMDYTQLYVSANGLIGFNSASLSSSANTDLPNAAAPNAIIAPFWDDLAPGALGSVHIGTVGQAPNRRLVVSWVAVPYGGYPLAFYTFQAVLSESTHEILFQYQALGGKGAGSQGQSATVGIENSVGTLAAKHSFNGSSLLANESALLFKPPSVNVSLTIATAPRNTVTIGLLGVPNQAYTIQTSPDLAQWTDRTTLTTGSDGRVVYEDTTGTAKRFYRALPRP